MAGAGHDVAVAVAEPLRRPAQPARQVGDRLVEADVGPAMLGARPAERDPRVGQVGVDGQIAVYNLAGSVNVVVDVLYVVVDPRITPIASRKVASRSRGNSMGSCMRPAFRGAPARCGTLVLIVPTMRA